MGDGGLHRHGERHLDPADRLRREAWDVGPRWVGPSTLLGRVRMAETETVKVLLGQLGPRGQRQWSRAMEYRARPFATEEDRVYARALAQDDLAVLGELLRLQSLLEIRDQVPHRPR